jgi:hypothetical protein
MNPAREQYDAGMRFLRRVLGHMPMRVRALGFVLVLMLGLPGPFGARAAGLADADARAVRQVVEAQFDAFAAGDADRAFSYASDSIRAQFGNAGDFVAMVRRAYPMVIQPAAVSFFLARAVDGIDGAVSQQVQLRDREGRLWMATYVLARQVGAGWRIDGCVVVVDRGKSLT